MNEEQKTIAKRLGIVAAILATVVLVIYFVYSPKEEAVATGPAKVYAPGNKSVAGVFRAGTWYTDAKGNGKWDEKANVVIQTGKAGDTPLTGTWETAVGPSVGSFSNGVFTLVIGGKAQIFTFGDPGDTPVIGDWNGDGRSKIGVFRKGFWRLDYNGNGKWDGTSIDRLVALGGTPGEIPVVGDWNGDGKTDLGVYRTDFTFAIDNNGSGGWDKDDKIFSFGHPNDVPIVGDWNGDGRSKVGTFKAGFWSLDYDGDQRWDTSKDKFIALGGVAGDVPVMGDWNGDGRTKVGIYRQNVWILDSNGNGVHDKTDITWNFGLPGDIPMALTPLRVKK